MGLPEKRKGLTGHRGGAGKGNEVGEETEAYLSLTDTELWNRLRKGDKGALGFIYDEYFSRLFNYGMKFCRDEDLVKDSIQDLFITLWHTRGQLSASDSIKFYLYASLKRKIIAETKLLRRPVRNFEFVASPEDELIFRQEEKQKYDRLLRMINKLSSRQKEVLFLRYYEGLSSGETAAIMSLSVNSVYVLLSKALDFLRKSRNKIVHLFIFWQLPELF